MTDKPISELREAWELARVRADAYVYVETSEVGRTARALLAALEREKQKGGDRPDDLRQVRPDVHRPASMLGAADTTERTAEDFIQERIKSLRTGGCLFAAERWEEALRLVRALRSDAVKLAEQRDEYMNKGLKACIENERLLARIEKALEHIRNHDMKAAVMPYCPIVISILSGEEE